MLHQLIEEIEIDRRASTAYHVNADPQIDDVDTDSLSRWTAGNDNSSTTLSSIPESSPLHIIDSRTPLDIDNANSNNAMSDLYNAYGEENSKTLTRDSVLEFKSNIIAPDQTDAGGESSQDDDEDSQSSLSKSHRLSGYNFSPCYVSLRSIDGR